MILMRSIDNCICEIVRHLFGGAQVIVHPELNDVDVLSCLRVYCRLYFGNICEPFIYPGKSAITASVNETLARRIDASHGWSSSTLLVPQLEYKILVCSHTEDSGNPIGGVRPQIAFNLLASEKFLILR